MLLDARIGGGPAGPRSVSVPLLRPDCCSRTLQQRDVHNAVAERLPRLSFYSMGPVGRNVKPSQRQAVYQEVSSQGGGASVSNVPGP